MDSRYLEPTIELADAATLRELQEARLREQVTHAYTQSAFYHAKLDAAGVRPTQVQRLEDLARLPFTTKDELKAAPDFQYYKPPSRTTSSGPGGTTGTAPRPTSPTGRP